MAMGGSRNDIRNDRHSLASPIGPNNRIRSGAMLLSLRLPSPMQLCSSTHKGFLPTDLVLGGPALISR